MEDTIEELDNREKRSVNLILYNLEEPNVVDHGNVTTDIDLVNDIIKKILPDNNIKKSCVRLGAKKQDHVRPLRVTLSSKSDVISVSRNKSRYNGPVEITNDLTQMQRKHLADLRAKLKVMRDAGDTNKIIRYINGTPKIVQGHSHSLSEQKNAVAPL